MTSPALYTQTKCNINGKELSGKVIAVATYFDHRKVCFLIENQEIGEWVLESALIPNWSPSEKVNKDIQPYMSTNKTATFEVKQDIPSEHKKLPNTFPNSTTIPSFSSAERVKTEATQYAKVEKQAKTEAQQDIHALVKFVTDTQNAIQNKTAKDIQTVFKLFAEAKSAIEEKTKATAKSLLNTDKQAREWLNEATKGIGQQVVSPLIKTLNDYGKIWRDRLVETINSVDLKKAKEAVNKLKESYPNEQSWQIANRLIQEKAIFATITGLAGVVPVLGQAVVDWYSTIPSLIEMIFQIAICYGVEDLDSEKKKGEILVICLTVISSDSLSKLGVEFLKNHTPISGAVVGPAINLMLFHAVGYAACEFYKPTPKGALTALGEKVEAYLEEAISEKAAVEKVAKQAVSMKEQLVLS